MASFVTKSTLTTLSPVDSTVSYDTGGSLGVGTGAILYARNYQLADDEPIVKPDTDFGTSGRVDPVTEDLTTLSPVDSTVSYDTGGSLGVGTGAILYARKRSTGFKILTVGTLASGGPAPMAASPVTAQWNISELVDVGQAAFGDARVTLHAIEASLAGEAGDARVTQHAIEIAMAADPPAARVTLHALEASLEGLPGDARVTQHAIEIAMRDDRPELYNSVPRVAPTDGANGVPLVPVFELYLDGSTLRVSTTGVVIGTQPYGPGVLSFGSINRELDPQGGDFRVSELQMEMDNSTGVWSAVKAQGITGRTCRVKLADPRYDISEAATIYTGTIATGWSLTRTRFRFSVVDVFARLLGVPFNVPIRPDKFVAMPDTEESGNIVPMVFGHHLEGEGRRKGQMPAYLIHTDYDDPILGVGTFRCVAAQGSIESIDQVFVNGVEQTEGVDWVSSSTTAYKFFIDNSTLETIWYITLLTDPRDETANPPSEDATDGVRVTWSGKGYYNVFYSSSMLAETNPAYQLREFMKKHTSDFRGGDPFASGVNRSGTGMLYTDFDAASVEKAAQYYAQEGIVSNFAVTDPQTTMRDVLTNFAQSFGLLVTSNVNGKVRFIVRTNVAQQPGFVEHLLEGVHIVEDTIEFSSVRTVLGSIKYNYDYDFIDDRFAQNKELVSADGASQNFGGSSSLDLLYVRDGGVATVVAQDVLFFAEEGRVVMYCKVDPHLARHIDIGDVIAVTAAAGPTEDGLGFAGRFMRVLSNGFNFSAKETTMSIRAIDVDGYGAGGEGQAFRAFSDIFATVADPVGVEAPQLDATGTDNPERTDLG